MARPVDELAESLDYPMVVVTASASGEHAGCLAGFTTQCSIDPARWIVCISTANHTYDVAIASDVLAVHVLRTSQRDLADLFGSETGDEIDKFARCDWFPGPGGVPVLAETDWFAGRVLTVWDAGDHTSVLLDVLPGGSTARVGEPQLGYRQIRDLEPGHD